METRRTSLRGTHHAPHRQHHLDALRRHLHYDLLVSRGLLVQHRHRRNPARSPGVQDGQALARAVRRPRNRLAISEIKQNERRAWAQAKRVHTPFRNGNKTDTPENALRLQCGGYRKMSETALNANPSTTINASAPPMYLTAIPVVAD